MKKRGIAVFLILFILLPAAVSAGSVLFAPENPFELFDENWDISLDAAMDNGEIRNDFKAVPLPDENRYIVKFNSHTDFETIAYALKSVPFRQLAESEERLFAISDTGGSFFDEFADIIDYSEPDLVRGTMALTDDPAVSGAYEQVGIPFAWDTVKGSESVIVAVLDTGVDRTHEDLADTKILPGYDAVTKKAGVYEDTAGHGTGVIGIIAATANNGKGIAGVAHGVTILPVKVTSASTTIYSSDLISGIRFAANAGAKILNMSMGGYSSSYAEQEAVNYALSKGCILISASGNEGNLPYAGEKSYPASYEGVISVASCGPDGSRSAFSQYNDMVDVAAPGEMIPMPFTDAEGNHIYRSDSGTSYSCAFVSGIAALAVSGMDEGVRFNSDEFLALIMDTCGSARNDEFGYGIINAKDITDRIDLPIITGVSDKCRYFESITVGFNRGIAYLDGEPFEDGDLIIANGKHNLTVIDGDNERRISFRLEYDPLSYEFKEFVSFAYFEFDRGIALLDGFPYKSGQRITVSGRHNFMLTDGEESIQREIDLRYSLPLVYGIEDGGVYTEPMCIRIAGDGRAFLDGEEFFGETAVGASGLHTLTVESGNGALKKDYTFEINFPYGRFYDTDYAGGKAAIDEENGYFCLYGDSLAGARIYELGIPEFYLHFLPVGRVDDHIFIDDRLILMGENGLSLINREQALEGETAIADTVTHENISLYLACGNEIFAFGGENLYKIDAETLQPIFAADIGFECETALYADGMICMAAPEKDRLIRIYDIESGEIFGFTADTDFDGDALCFGEGYVAVGNSLADARTGETLLEFCSYSAKMIKNGLVYAENVIIDIATGEEIGIFPFSVSDIITANERIYLFGNDKKAAVIKSGAEGLSAFGAAARTDAVFSAAETASDYLTNLYYESYLAPKTVAADENFIYAIFNGKNKIFSFDLNSLTEGAPAVLKYEPREMTLSGGYLAVTFENNSLVYLAPVTDIAKGVYIEMSADCVSMCVFNNTFYAVSGGRLVHCAPDGSNMRSTSLRAERTASDGERIYTVGEGVLTVYDQELNRIASAEVNGDRLFVSSAVVAGDTIFDPAVSAKLGTAPESITALYGTAYVYGGGVYDLLSTRYIGSIGTDSPEAVVMTAGGRIIVFDNGAVYIHNGGDDIAELPIISGIEDGSIYNGSTFVEFSKGLGYIDGEPVISGVISGNAGEHSFILSLPFGQFVSIDYTVEANIERIEFLSPQRTLSVGETVTLRVRYLPDGASSVPVEFTASSNGLEIGEMGEITALKVGVYTVTATVTTEYGRFTAQCRITVRDDLISFTPESGITVNRDNGLALGITPGTTVKQLKEYLYTQKEFSVIDTYGNEVNGVVATGHKLMLFDGNEIADELTVVINGDTDGDGYVSAYDMYVLERILKNHKYDQAFLAAADINGNGILADNDFRALRNIILQRTTAETGTPGNNIFGLGYVQTVSHIESGDIIDVPICISGCKYARGVSGVLNYSDGLEFIEGEIIGWDGAARDIGKNRVSFYVYGNNGEECGKAFMVLINLKFRVTASAGSTVKVSSEGFTTAFKSGARMIRFEENEMFIYEPLVGEPEISFGNAYSFEFSPDVHEYTAVIPYNSALADISVTRNIGQEVAISGLVIPESGNRTVTVSINSIDGSSEIYTIRVRRDSEPRFDTNCNLATLEIEGFQLVPQFSPEITEYTVTVPEGTERINIHCTAQSGSASVAIGDTALHGDRTAVTVTVSSPDGESRVYTINVIIAPPQTESSEVSTPEPKPDDSIPVTTILAVIGGVMGASVIVVLYLKAAKKDEEIRNSESTDSHNNETT